MLRFPKLQPFWKYILQFLWERRKPQVKALMKMPLLLSATPHISKPLLITPADVNPRWPNGFSQRGDMKGDSLRGRHLSDE